MRLFHAILAGCIPVVILFPGGSWYRNYGPSVERSFPFVDRIDWHKLAVEILHDTPHEHFSEWAKRLVPELLRQTPQTIQARQHHLAAASRLLRYDFHGHSPDAFTA